MASSSLSKLSSSAAVSDLGLGDMINQQLSDQEEERKKQMLGSKTLTGNAATDLGLGTPGY